MQQSNQTVDNGSKTVIRSKYRGLSWDKKHQGWRVRIYFAGKQRHVGRFEDDVTAAKAYDKAAVYLYGSNAITNFGLDACQVDPTEVSSFIIMAKEQAEQEQMARSQHRQHYYMVAPQQMYVASLHQQPHQQQQQQQPIAPQYQGMSLPAMLPQVPQGLQQQQQMWTAGGLPTMLQQPAQQVPVAAGAGYATMGHMPQDACVMQQYPVEAYALPAGQGMQAGSMLAPAAAGGGLPAGMGGLQHQQQYVLQSQLQQQPQQVIMSGSGPAPGAGAGMVPVSLPTASPVQHAMVAAAGYGSMNPAAAVSNAPAPAHLGSGAHQELVLQHPGGAHDGSPLASGAFVQDMLQSLNYAAAGQTATAAMLQHQQAGMMLPVGPACVPAGSSLGSSSQQPVSWAMSLAPAGNSGHMQQGYAVSAAMTDGSPSYSVASSTGGANTNTAFTMPRMGASSAACA